MSEENNTVDQGKEQEHSEHESGSLSREQWQKRENAMAKQISELRSQMSAIAQEREAKEKAELEAQQKWKELAEKTSGELERYKREAEDRTKAFEAERLSMRIDAQLKDSGVANEFSRDGIRSRYLSMDERPEFEKYIADLKQAQPELFAPAKISVGVKNSPVGTANQFSHITDEQLAQMLKSPDPKIRMTAHRENLQRAGLDPAQFGV
jgi:hypothetical protein